MYAWQAGGFVAYEEEGEPNSMLKLGSVLTTIELLSSLTGTPARALNEHDNRLAYESVLLSR
mgnify:FL=1